MNEMEITKWCWYMGRFLFDFEDGLTENPNMSITNFFQTFRNENGLLDVHGFRMKNQGTVMMLLYGLLVFPRELWLHQNNLPEFLFDTRNHFNFIIGDNQMNSHKFIILLRHAIAHANVSIDVETGTYCFSNITRDGTENFKVTILHAHICEFLGEVGRYFINVVGNEV